MSDPASPPPAPLGGPALLFATVVLGLGSFMNILDMAIANVSVPTIAGDLGVSYTQGTWVITSYAVSEAIMLPMTGWLAQRFGQVRMFVAATLLFTLASLMCGIAFSFPMLVVARILQGAVGASMIPLSQTLMTSIYPPDKRGLAMGLWSMTTILAPIAGPMTGGWLTENFSWHWIFLINLPIGLLVAGGAWALLAGRESTRRSQQMDYIGLALLIVGVGSLQILLDKGNELDWFGSTEIVALAVVSVVALSFFVVWELGEEHPLVELRLFASRNFLVGVLCLLFGMVSYFGTVVVQPLWLQTYLGYSPLWAGKVVAFSGVFGVLLGPVIGANMQRLDARRVAVFGMTTFALVSWWSTRFTPDVDYWTLALSRMFMGLGISCFFLPIFTINLSGLAPQQIAAASGLSSFMRNIGSSFGTATMVSLWDHRAVGHHAVLAEHISAYQPAAADYLARLQSLGLAPQQALAQIQREIDSQAHLLATNDLMLLGGLIMFALVFVVIWARPPFIGRGGH
ncbi:MAG: DHA2 family efflux MFS transporter permease subunit [Rhodocyclaceae bacterium]